MNIPRPRTLTVLVGTLLLFSACATGRGGGADSPQDMRAAAEKAATSGGLFGARDCLGAERRIRELKQRYPYHALSVESDLVLAECALAEGRPSEAIARWQAFLRLNPGHRRAPEARLNIARAYLEMVDDHDRDLGAASQALSAANRLIREHPESEHTDRAVEIRSTARGLLAKRELYVARHYRRRGELLSARARYETVVQRYGDLPLADSARTELARIRDRLDLPDDEGPVDVYGVED